MVLEIPPVFGVLHPIAKRPFQSGKEAVEYRCSTHCTLYQCMNERLPYGVEWAVALAYTTLGAVCYIHTIAFVTGRVACKNAVVGKFGLPIRVSTRQGAVWAIIGTNATTLAEIKHAGINRPGGGERQVSQNAIYCSIEHADFRA